ncbi:AAA family ATPase [Arthrobacter sp. Sr33]
MSLIGPGFDIIGASLFGPPPIDAVHLELEAGMTVLYGQNGAGKSKILQELSAVLHGIGPNHPGGVTSGISCLHLRLTSLDRAVQEVPGIFLKLLLDWDFERNALEVLQESVAKSLVQYRIIDEGDEEWYESLFPGTAGVFISLFPRGTQDEPSFEVWISSLVSIDDRTGFAEHVASNYAITQRLLNEAEKLSPTQITEILGSVQRNPLSPWVEQDNPVAVRSDHRGMAMSSRLDGWPERFPVPLFEFASVGEGLLDVITTDASLEALEADTLGILRGSLTMGSAVEVLIGDEFEYAPSLVNEVEKLVAEANKFLSNVFPNRFALRLDLKSPSDWFMGNTPAWLAVSEAAGGLELPLTELSAAERRWASAAIGWGQTYLSGFMPQVLLIDEPEQGLHRELESLIASRLSLIAGPSGSSTVIVASHSPGFLEAPGVSQLVHVSRDEKARTRVASLDLSSTDQLKDDAHRLGMQPHDLLQLMRVAVIVEGKHDEVVLGRLLAEDLRDSGARIFPLMGAKGMRSLVESKILFDATDSIFLIVLDNLKMEKVGRAWREAEVAVENNNPRAAKAALRNLEYPGSGGESKWLRALGDRAVELGRLSRIKVCGLSERDIICYLPVDMVVPGQGSWTQLEAEFERAREFGAENRDFKEYLIRKKSASISVRSLTAAAGEVDIPHREIQDLGLFIRSLGQFPATDGM